MEYCEYLGEFGQCTIWHDRATGLYIVPEDGLVAMLANFEDARRFAQEFDLVEVKL